MEDSPTRPGPSAAPAEHAALVSRLRAAGCVFAEQEADLLVAEAASAEHLEDMAARRIAGLPLEQVLGWAEFCGVRIAVSPGVFVPRRRTELLVREAAALIEPGAVVLDLCCGSGAIGVAISAAVPRVELHAADSDPVAVVCARRNVDAAGGTVYEGDLDAPLPPSLHGRVDVLVACPPYVPTDSLRLMPPEARDHEPRSALDGGSDGLDIVRRLANLAATWLAPGGHLLVESSDPQAPAVFALFAAAGLSPHVATSEDLGATVVIGSTPTAF
jgi:release factor glutamine methyltransferase